VKLVGDRFARAQLAGVAAAEDEPLGQFVEDLVEVLDRERVAVAPPPLADDAIGEDDDVTGVLDPVDQHPTRSVSLDPRHRAQA
jgi:hypothetical protein